ncbi:MAG: hypothetical protein KDD61_04435 [Bdellovibrionales bacterium]|nr:hypothetical protein [Bdellovibrionales bacterium]
MSKIFLFAAVLLLAPFSQAEYDIPLNIEMNSADPANSYSYNFGRVRVNSVRYARFDVTNTGDTPLTFQAASISGPGYSANHSCRGVLEVSEKCLVEIRYWPPFEGFQSGQFQLKFKELSPLVIRLLGQGVKDL